MTEKYFKMDSFGIYEGDYLHRLDRLMIYHRLNELYYENEKLKQFQEKVFSWIDKEISQNEEAIEWGEKQGADVGAMGFYTNMLKMFQKDFTDGQYNK